MGLERGKNGDGSHQDQEKVEVKGNVTPSSLGSTR